MQNPVGQEGVPLLDSTAAEDGAATEVEERLCPTLHPCSHGGDAVPHLLEHAPTVHSVEGIGEIQEEGPSPLRWGGCILLHPGHRVHDGLTTAWDSDPNLGRSQNPGSIRPYCPRDAFRGQTTQDLPHRDGTDPPSFLLASEKGGSTEVRHNHGRDVASTHQVNYVQQG